MILSFSVPEMKPYIEAGLQQAKGVNIKTRVKRQTIRKWGPQAERVLRHEKFPYRLSLWWKSRTSEREFLGSIEHDDVKAYPITIHHGDVGIYVEGCSAWDPHMNCYCWAKDAIPGVDFWAFSDADGFDSPEAFRDYFVPNPDDVFKGILYKW